MSPPDLIRRLVEGPPIVFDGGTGAGTEVEIARRHRAFVKAGADAVIASSLVAVRSEDPEGLTRAAVALARASARTAFVCSSLGPLGDGGRVAERLDACIAGAAEADGICVETMIRLGDAARALASARERGFPGPVLVTFAVDASGRGYGGLSVEEIVVWAERAKPDAVGFNCGAGPASVLAAGTRLRWRLPGIPLVLRPAAGEPRGPVATPSEFAAFASEALSLRLRAAAVGGCCGATPRHIEEVAQVVANAGRMG